ncbi:MAG: hypothetical protein M1360_04500 [Candidatus Marsarchaeota archaeon]|jgi:hypothetical protein|nr:hypothetical protein [Candidatus Marsarchaeota archaeon]MCL5419166.1 hypothetical protein [Candidatus Marsarchaeota archaeon]
MEVDAKKGAWKEYLSIALDSRLAILSKRNSEIENKMEDNHMFATVAEMLEKMFGAGVTHIEVEFSTSKAKSEIRGITLMYRESTKVSRKPTNDEVAGLISLRNMLFGEKKVLLPRTERQGLNMLDDEYGKILIEGSVTDKETGKTRPLTSEELEILKEIFDLIREDKIGDSWSIDSNIYKLLRKLDHLFTGK